MNKKFRKLILPVSLLVALQSNALGLGSLQVNSSLDEVLNGEIPFVIDSTEEIESIEVSVASYSEYEKVGLDKSYVPSNISVSIIEKNGEKLVQLSSKGPVSEPIVSLLLVVDWSNGHLLREYTLLLDPPMFQNSQTSDYSDTAQTNTYIAPKPIDNTTQPVSQISAQSNNSYSSSSQVVVESGDTLWQIANRYNNGNNTPQQMMVAIFNSNPNAFQNDDMNRLSKGAVLTIPDSDQVSMVSNGQALSEVRSHTQNWSSTQALEDSSDGNSSSVDYAIELIPPSDSETSDMNDSSGSTASARINTQTIADLNKAKEQLASSNLENSELSSRITELEKIVEDQELALTLKDTNLAQLQDQLSSEDNNTTIVDEDNNTTVENVDLVDEDNNTTVENVDLVDEDMSTDDVWDDTEESNVVIDSGEMASSDEMTDANDMTSSDEMTDANDKTSSDEMTDSGDMISPENTASVEQQAVVDTPVRKETSWIDHVMEYKMWLIGLGALLIGFLGFVLMKRRSGDSDGLDSGGFLDSIESDDFNSPIDSDTTELDLSNIDNLENLDDKTDLEVSEEIESSEMPEVVVMNDADEQGIDLELDLDLDAKINSSNEEVLEELESPEMDFDDELSIDIGSDLEEDSLDFDLNVDGNLQANEGTVKVTEEEFEDLEFDLSDDLFDSDELEFDIDDESTEELDLDDELEADLDLEEELTFDLEEDLELDSTEDDLVEAPEEIIEDKTELNLTTLNESDSSIQSDLDDTEDSLIEFSSDEDVDIGLDFEDLPGDDAIDTKLDLAKAYFEMGDTDGAKQMVEEIIVEGNDEQKSTAIILKSEIEGS